MMKRIGNMMIIFSIGILIYIFAGNYAQESKTARLMEEFEQLPFEELNETLTDVSAQAASDASKEATTDVFELAGVNASPASAYEVGAVLAVLEIPKIDLTVPIVHGAGAEQLSAAVGHLAESGDLAEIGSNFAIAGHRSATFGQFFNRLDELEPGDSFTVRTHTETYTYSVVNKTVVMPTDVQVIDPVVGKSQVTLITCHPFRSNKKRLIVGAELVNLMPGDAAASAGHLRFIGLNFA